MSLFKLFIAIFVIVSCFRLNFQASPFFKAHAKSTHLEHQHHPHKTGIQRNEFLRLHNFVNDHMVLQREPQKARIWGRATPKINVTVQLDDKLVAFGVADGTGSWSVDLPPHPASADHELTISDGISKVKVRDVAFGDVFLCSGQSNMEMSVQVSMNATAEIADSINYPNLRLATVLKNAAGSKEWSAESSAANYTWSRSGPDAFQLKPPFTFSHYSATCYFFGRDLYKQLDGKVPIGLVTSCWGGQRVEAFSSKEALEDTSCGGTVVEPSIKGKYTAGKIDPVDDRIMLEKDPKHDDDYSEGDDASFMPKLGGMYVPQMSLWNGMIHPLLPMRFAGAVWYQGESNADNATSYACRFPAMIADWRRKFELGLPFYYVELAGYEAGKTWPYVRAAQGAALKLDNVSFATAIDLADPSSPVESIHPRRKQEVGRRLSVSVLATQYHKNTKNHGPELESFQHDMETGLVLLYFTADTATPLHFHGSADCDMCCSVSSYEIMDQNGNWKRVPRSRVVRQMSVALEGIPKDTKVLGVRYAWEPFPECILYVGEGGPDDHKGLPAAPFERCLYPSKNGPWTGAQCTTTTVVQYLRK